MKNIIKQEFIKLKHNKKYYSLFIILIVLILFSITSTFAKYILSINGQATSHIDQVYYAIIEDSSETLENNKADYYFHVNNYEDDDHINQVLMKYYLKINNTSSASTTISNKLYYKDNTNNWIEIPKITTGDYTDYYEGMGNLGFDTKTTHEYKMELTTEKETLTEFEYDFSIDIKLIQTQP